MMSDQRPLYKLEDDGTYLQQQSKHRHAGLYFDKFCDKWSENWTIDGELKLKWINHFTKDPVGTREDLQESIRRLMWLIKKCGGQHKIFKSEYRFVTGLGRSHPVENGFTWHPTLGTPYLPGSSIKGLVRAWAAEQSGSSSDKRLNRLLGSPKNTGSICFLDAIPTEPVRLKADVMTPHYASWTEENPPGDWHSPTPIPFLVMAEQTSLLFGMIPCGAVEDDDLCTVARWLQDALTCSGAGAKTAVGYGHFGYDEKETSDRSSQLDQEHKQAEAQKSPEEYWRSELKGKSEKDVLEEIKKLNKKEDRFHKSVHRYAFAKVISSDYKPWLDKWRSGKRNDQKTNYGKKKLKEYAKTIDQELNDETNT